MEHSPGFLAYVESRRPNVREVTVADARSALATLPKARLIDVREDREYAAAHAAGAMHLSRGILERDIELVVPDRNTPIYLYCGGGHRSALAADALQQMGYRAVHSVAGGWLAWQEAGAPIVAPTESIDAIASQLREAGFAVIAGRPDDEGEPTVLIEGEDGIFQLRSLGPRRLIS
jgi:rhodanese-related sulfurtransferase